MHYSYDLQKGIWLSNKFAGKGTCPDVPLNGIKGNHISRPFAYVD